MLYRLARNRRSPKRPPEPRLSSVHLNKGGVEEKKRSRLEVEGMVLGLDKRQEKGIKGVSTIGLILGPSTLYR